MTKPNEKSLPDRMTTLEKQMAALVKHKTDELNTMGKMLVTFANFHNELQRLKKLVDKREKV